MMSFSRASATNGGHEGVWRGPSLHRGFGPVEVRGIPYNSRPSPLSNATLTSLLHWPGDCPKVPGPATQQ